MEKTIQLDQREVQAAQGIDQELTQAWAQVGMFSEQLDQARKLRDQAVEKQRGLIRQALTARGIERFENARPGQQMGTLLVVVPDDVPVPGGKPQGLPPLDEMHLATTGNVGPGTTIPNGALEIKNS